MQSPVVPSKVSRIASGSLPGTPRPIVWALPRFCGCGTQNSTKPAPPTCVSSMVTPAIALPSGVQSSYAASNVP